MQWTVDNIVQATGGRLLYGEPGSTFAGVGIDSRTIGPDRLFVAICGQNHDGHTFVDAVVAKGVRGLVIQETAAVRLNHESLKSRGVVCVGVTDTTRALGDLARFQRRQSRIPVVAITGSNGKTSTRLMTAAVMGRRYNTLSTQGNLNNDIGLPLTLFNLSPAHQAAVLELGMNHAGELSRLGAICQPTIGIITNVGPAHLEFFGTLEGVARSKAELIAQVEPQGSIVLNGDDPLVASMAAGAGSRRIVWFGTMERAQVRAEGIREIREGMMFELILPAARTTVQLKSPGRFMVFNALAAAAAGFAAGLSVQEIRDGLESFRQIKGRLQVMETAKGVHIIDDTYNANPASMAAAIDTLQALRGSAPGFIMVGDMLELGDQAGALHREVGVKAAAGRPTRLYACGNFALDVAQGARQAGMDPEAIFTGTKQEAALEVIRHLTSGSWVLVKGSRGMAMETVAEVIRTWADRE